jgi:hypothetical protein
MIRIIFLVITLLASASVISAEIQCLSPQFEWKVLSPGVLWTKHDIKFTPFDHEQKIWTNDLNRKVTLRILKLDLSLATLQFIKFDPSVQCNPQTDRFIKKLLDTSKEKNLAAINASFFDMNNSNVLGLAYDQNKLWADNLNTLKSNSSAVFTVKNLVPQMIDKDDFTKSYGEVVTAEQLKDFSLAVQAYPRLLRDDQIIVSQNVLNTRRPRTAIGFSQEEKFVYLITIDARGENDTTGMTLYEFGHFLKNSSCGINLKTALNLDGGGSTAFAIPSQAIYEQADRCRPLGNILTIKSRNDL